MPAPAISQLAAALERVHRAAQETVVRSDKISRRDRELLQARGWLWEIIRGWYLLATPEAKPGDTVLWHSGRLSRRILVRGSVTAIPYPRNAPLTCILARWALRGRSRS